MDHSTTYRILTFKNLVHIARLKRIIWLVGSLGTKDYYLDVGCSNGYVTDIISRKLNVNRAYGCDHNSDNLDVARNKFPKITFFEKNLNELPDMGDQKFDLVTCFETLEHVGNLNNAIDNILAYGKSNSIILISVPIEVGFVGVVKYLLKLLYGYSVKELNCDLTSWKYFLTLIDPRRTVSIYRENSRSGYSTHFGFDFNLIDDILFKKRIKYESSIFFTTKFYIIDCSKLTKEVLS
jgi:2-polyprenyl-3-methyl-5-hydroxy-6-metoxy-1,4-benzoquinol methylase